MKKKKYVKGLKIFLEAIKMQLYRKRPSEKEKRKEHNRQICLWAVRSHAAIEIVHILFLMRIFRSVCVWKWTYVRENTMSFAMEIGVQHRRSYTIICQFFENSATQNDSMILNRMYSFSFSTFFYICSNLWFNILGVIVDEMLNGIYYRVLPGDYFVIYSWIRVLSTQNHSIMTAKCSMNSISLHCSAIEPPEAIGRCYTFTKLQLVCRTLVAFHEVFKSRMKWKMHLSHFEMHLMSRTRDS